ncbi:MAG TPA: 23S rRNA (pseudouridine(1915)-N(3))-methyltransferase RlmH [Gemmatimonadales bacterium]|nr:23S rRNA (pseudouridine(1915)-N(3))-methyltransferase RlmH [Gemmatimonadales bacterium]
MEIALLAVGRLRPYYREACDEYLRRLRRYARVTEREVKEAAHAPTPVQQQEEEAARLLAGAPAGAALVALDLGGAPWSSEELARQVERWQLAARPVALLVGGSTGLAPGLRQQAAQRWSLGPLTLPHELARVVVCEQLYRAFTILRGEPYHKGGRT